MPKEGRRTWGGGREVWRKSEKESRTWGYFGKKGTLKHLLRASWCNHE